MNEFIYCTLVPTLYFIVLLFGALGILSLIICALSKSSKVCDFFDDVFIVAFGGVCIVGIILMMVMGISGLVMLYS
jgi:hypothetical protein